MGYEGVDGAFAEAVLDAIQAAGISERSVYLAAGIPVATWDRVINKRVGSLRLTQADRVARALNMPLGELLPDPQVAA